MMADKIIERIEMLSLDFFSGTASEVIQKFTEILRIHENTHRDISVEPEDRYILIYGTRDMNEDELKTLRYRQDRMKKQRMYEEFGDMMEQTINKLSGEQNG